MIKTTPFIIAEISANHNGSLKQLKKLIDNAKEHGANAVKIQTYDFLRYGSLRGLVKNVAADVSRNAAGNPYFRVVIETDKTFLGETAGSLPITSGMLAEVNIKTGNRSVFDYLVSPILKLRHAAFKER